MDDLGGKPHYFWFNTHVAIPVGTFPNNKKNRSFRIQVTFAAPGLRYTSQMLLSKESFVQGRNGRTGEGERWIPRGFFWQNMLEHLFFWWTPKTDLLEMELSVNPFKWRKIDG